jgi:hypothetical protein
MAPHCLRQAVARASGEESQMKWTPAIFWIVLALPAGYTTVAMSEPVLMLNEPRDIFVAQHACTWAEGEIKQDQYLIKSFTCAESDLCQRAIDIKAVCKVTGADADVRGFHRKLLAQFASNSQCAISIVRLTDGKTPAEVQSDAEAFKKASWELNLGFRPGASKQQWALWPHQSGNINPAGLLEGEGDPAQIARDVCTIMTRSGAKVLN